MKEMGEFVYECEECGIKYFDAKTAKDCEDWCAKHHSCNTNIIKNAIKNVEVKK
jgi:hypothetical protein